MYSDLFSKMSKIELLKEEKEKFDNKLGSYATSCESKSFN